MYHLLFLGGSRMNCPPVPTFLLGFLCGFLLELLSGSADASTCLATEGLADTSACLTAEGPADFVSVSASECLSDASVRIKVNWPPGPRLCRRRWAPRSLS
ncbi:hypothetical protein AMECASPLE_031723 [Ameca splendens]|uniref:Secreted protein n=1 Tax=Ameca splendens TaxID=208324 RepID=A0ABV1AE77_9TELE